MKVACDQANTRTVPVHIKAATTAAKLAGTICVLTWSIKSQPVVIALNIVVSDIGEHWSPNMLPFNTAAKQIDM